MPQIISSSVVDVYPFCVANGRVQFLALLRTPGRPMGNTWQAVHGRIDKRHTAVQAAAHILFAQTHIHPDSLWNIDYVNNYYSPAEDAIYLAPSIGALVPREASVQLTPEHVNWEWLSAEAAMRRFLWIGERLAVQTLQDEVAGPMAMGRSANPQLEIDRTLYVETRRGGR